MNHLELPLPWCRPVGLIPPSQDGCSQTNMRDHISINVHLGSTGNPAPQHRWNIYRRVSAKERLDEKFSDRNKPVRFKRDILQNTSPVSAQKAGVGVKAAP